MILKCGLLLLFAATVQVGAEPLKLTIDGRPNAEVVLDITQPQRQLQYAAQELTNWLGRISGAAIPVVATPGALPVKIVLGTPKFSPAIAQFAKANAKDFAKLEESDGFIIRQQGDTIFIAAELTKGVLNGVYRFLELNTDIIFVREFEAETGCGTIYGQHPSIVNTIENLVDVPVFPRGRHFTGFTYENLAWQARLLNVVRCSVDGNLSLDRYRAMNLLQRVDSMVGTLSLGLIDPEKYAQTNPDFFPLIRGERVTYHDCQLCFMNPKMIEAFCEEAARVVASNPTTVITYSVGLGDNWEVCACDLCRAPITLPDGTTVRPTDKNFRSTQYTLFVNAVSDYLTTRFPHVQPLTSYTYLFTADAPAVLSREGSHRRYCPYIKNHKKPVYDDTVNANWHAKAEAFKKSGRPATALYEYYLCSSTPQFYHAVCDVAQKDFNYYRPALKDVYLDTVYGDTANFNGDKVYDISSIEFWVMSRLMWDPDVNVQEARRTFCRRAYREAAQPMIDYYETLAANYNDDPAGCYWNDDPISACKYYIVDKKLSNFVRTKLDEAVKKAVHPGSLRLIALHQARMLGLIDQAEKMPDKVTLNVPLTEKTPSADFLNAPEWKSAAVIDAFTKVSDSTIPAVRGSTVRFLHDKRNLYIAMRYENSDYYADFKAGKFARETPTDGTGDWNSLGGPYFELFIDGGLRDAGSYYHFAFAVNGNRYTGQSASMFRENAPKWTAVRQTEPTYWTAFVTIPLSEIGVNITQGNKLGVMIVANHGAWNGGQWHSPTGFQNVILEMK